jgi:hypothetical protein
MDAALILKKTHNYYQVYFVAQFKSFDLSNLKPLSLIDLVFHYLAIEYFLLLYLYKQELDLIL